MILDRFLKRNREKVTAFPVDLSQGTFTTWGGDAYGNDIYRAAVDAIARNAGKLKGSHIVKSGAIQTPADSKLNRLLQVQPNVYMNAYDLLYKCITHYYLYNNSFLYIQRDGGTITGIYPLDVTQVDFLTDVAGGLYCKFTLKSGNNYVLPYTDIIHLRRNFNSNELLGDSNGALTPALELAHAQNEGIINGIQSGANIRGIVKFTQIMAPEKLKEERQRFIDDYLSMGSGGGILATDQKMEYVPITTNPAVIDADQIKATKEKIYDYLGVSESIVNSSYTEDQWAAFYESTIEPIAVQLGLEFTRKLFTEREQAFGNMIIFESSRLQFTSNATKVNLIKELMPYGLLTINQALEILNLPAVQDGNKRLQTLNVVDVEIARQYQLKRGGQDGNDKEDPVL